MAVPLGDLASFEAAVYNNVVDKMTANGTGMHQSAWHYELLPTEATRDDAHLSWAVKVDPTEPQNPINKQKAAALNSMKSTVWVRALYRIRPEAVDDYRLALVYPTVIRNALIDEATGSTYTNTDGLEFTGSPQHFRWIRSTNRLVGAGTYLLIELSFTCWHQTLNFGT